MRVVATDTGYDNIKVRDPGEEFDWPDNVAVPDWCEVVGEDGQGVPRTAKQKNADKGIMAQDLS